MSRTNVLGVEFDNVTMQEAVERAMELISERRCAYCATPNPEIVMLAKEDVALREALAWADMVLPDGAGIVKGAAILGRPMKQKVPGIDFACGVMAQLAERGGSVYLFGAKPGVAEAAGQTLKGKFPGLVISGTSDGYFSDDGPIIEKISAAAPDMLLVCLGAPKQELWMAQDGGKAAPGPDGRPGREPGRVRGHGETCSRGLAEARFGVAVQAYKRAAAHRPHDEAAPLRAGSGRGEAER